MADLAAIEEELRALRASGWWRQPSAVVDEVVLRALDADMTQKLIAELLGCSATSMSKRARRLREQRDPRTAMERVERQIFWTLRHELPHELRVEVLVNLLGRIARDEAHLSEKQLGTLERVCGNAREKERRLTVPEEIADLVVQRLISAGAALATLQALGRSD